MTPPQGIDRDALHGLVHRYTTGHLGTTEFETAVVALVRPVEGVVLTREEAALALPYIERAIETYPWEDDGPLRALAARLE